MRVAFIDESAHTKRHGGVSTWTLRLSHQLQAQGVGTQIYSFSDGIDTRIPDAIKLFPNIRELAVFPYIGKRVISKLDKKYDIIHLSSPTTSAFCKAQVPMVVSGHCLFSRQTMLFQKYLPFRYKSLFNPISYSCFRYLEAKGLRNADAIIVPKEAFKDFLVHHLNIPASKIGVIKYGVDEELFKPSCDIQAKENVALFVGRGTIAKGFDILLKAADSIRGKIIAVSSRLSKGYRQIVGSKKNFIVKSSLSLKEVIQLYQTAKVFVLPSLTEGSPLSTLEAMACGLPVVCTSEGGGEYIEDGVNGFIIPFRNSQILAEKVNYLFHHSDVAVEFGRKNRKMVEQELTVSQITSRVVECYKRLLA